MYKIYKIVSKKDVYTVYIGSTKQELHQRLRKHKRNSRYFSENTRKEKWITENYNDIEIVQINSASNLQEALLTEEAEILKHKEQGYTILNEQLPTTNKLILRASLPNAQLERKQKQNKSPKQRNKQHFKCCCHECIAQFSQHLALHTSDS